MARFYLGQRVKKVRGAIDIGNTGTIVEFDRNCVFGLDALVRWDNAGPLVNGLTHPPGDVAWTRQEFLEPVIPEGMQPVSWSECLWQPEGEIA